MFVDTVRALMLMDADMEDRSINSVRVQSKEALNEPTNRQALVESLRAPVGRRAGAEKALLDYLRG